MIIRLLRWKIIVIDGMSDDATPQIVNELGEQDSRVRMIENPERAVPFAMNRGIREARGEIVIRVDGHAEVDTLFVRNSVNGAVESSRMLVRWRIHRIGQRIGTGKNYRSLDELSRWRRKLSLQNGWL